MYELYAEIYSLSQASIPPEKAFPAQSPQNVRSKMMLLLSKRASISQSVFVK